MVKVTSNGPMDHLTKGSLVITKFMDTDYTLGTMQGNMTVTGNRIKWMELEFSIGVTEENTLDSMWTIKKKGMAYMNGPTVANMMARG